MEDNYEKLKDILEELSHLVDPNDEEIAKLAQELSCIYNSDNFRHSYYEISRQLEDMSADVRANLCSNYGLVVQVASGQYSADILKSFTKLYDHLNLETLRLVRMERVTFMSNKASKALVTAERLNRESNISVTRLKRRVNGFHGQSITILGIFAGLVLGFSAEIQFFTESFKNINNMSMRNMLLYLLIIGFIVFNTLFMLMYSVSKIADHSIAVLCKDRDCTICNQKHGPVKRMFRKYPYVVAFNIFMIIGLTITLIFIK